MYVDIQLNAAVLGACSQAVRQAARIAAETVKTDLIAAQTVPFDTGRLQGSLQVDQFQNGDEVHTLLASDTPYARRLYYHPEFDFQTVNNRNAGALWYAPYVPGGTKEAFVQEAFQDCLKKVLPK